MKNGILSTLSLFTSFSTLICCALPALLVTLGAGAAVAGLVSTLPFLVVLSKHKLLTFGAAGIMLLLAGFMRWNARNAPCPADPAKAAACGRLRKVNGYVYWFSVGFYLTGALFAFLAPKLFY